MLVTLLSVAAPALAQPCESVVIGELDGLLLGEGAPADIGSSIVGAPSLGGSRVPLLIGAPFDEDEDTNSGAVYVVDGVVAGAASVAESSTKVTGHRPGLRAGSAAAAGADGLWIGAPGDLAGRGAVYVLPWPAPEPSLSVARRVLGNSAGDHLGSSLTTGPAPWGSGDAVAAGAPEAGSGGRVYVFDATAGAPTSLDDASLIISDVSPGEQFGIAVAVGDADGDGVADLAVGAPGVGVGRVYLFYGPLEVPTAIDVGSADAVIEGDQGGDRAGASVLVAGGVDGLPGGLLVGAPLAQNGIRQPVGRACWFAGQRLQGTVSMSEARFCLWGTVEGGRAGHALASGDVNADGFSDVWIGVPEDGGGTAHLLLGPAIGSILVSRSDGRVRGELPGDALGESLAVVRDRDGDGYPDTFVGAPGYSSSGGVGVVRGGFCPPVDDVDRDGVPASRDCDDEDASRSPDVPEAPCNGIDDDCDGEVDEVEQPLFRDADDDGFGDGAVPVACGEDGVADATDCDDRDPEVFPGAPDVCGDGTDHDCDGQDRCERGGTPLGCLGSGGTFAWVVPLALLHRRRRVAPSAV